MKDLKFYKSFYEENRVALLQYKSLRGNFKKMADEVLGKNYYVDAYDVYDADKALCEAITIRANQTWLERLIKKVKW
ncbi:hypothetical protein VP199E371_P0054 [Vibrio phage 199E37-1]|nr:hypothetical protein VP199E371_P0054 [Vibrio phage 199E37-1]